MSVNIVCDGPGPHIPASGIIGQGNTALTGMRCSAAPCSPSLIPAAIAATAATANQATIQTRAQAALTANATFQALASPTNAQVLAQVQILTKENTALIKLALGLVSDTNGT